MGISAPAFMKKREDHGGFIAYADFQMPLTQNSQYTRAAYFGVACFELHH